MDNNENTNSFRDQNDLPADSIVSTTDENFNNTKFKKNNRKNTLKVVLISVFSTFIVTTIIFSLLLFSTVSSFLSQKYSTIQFDTEEETKIAALKLNDIISKIKNNYVEDLTDAQIIDAISKGLPSALENPYTY